MDTPLFLFLLSPNNLCIQTNCAVYGTRVSSLLFFFSHCPLSQFMQWAAYFVALHCVTEHRVSQSRIVIVSSLTLLPLSTRVANEAKDRSNKPTLFAILLLL